MATRWIIPAAIAALIAGTAAASAAPARTSGDLNLRTGPGPSYGRIAVIPAGSWIDVFDCSSWCRVEWEGRPGWVWSRHVAWGGHDLPSPRPGFNSYRDYRLGFFGEYGEPYRSPYDDPFLFDD